MSPPNIQWFPGHMQKARREIAQRLTQVDLVIEVLDARLPFSSENPMLAGLRGEKPCIKVLNKADLADATATTSWLDGLSRSARVAPLALCAKDRECATAIVAAAKNLLPGKSDSLRGIQTLITGIPNVGKSTLINLLAGRSIAKTGNEPAVTKRQQRIDLHNGIVLFDTPGVLWPNVENRNSGFRLAASGAIRDTALDYTEVALFALDYLTHQYPRALLARYPLTGLARSRPDGDDSVATLEAIGRACGCLGRGGEVDWQRAAKVLINDLRSTALGRLTLETPAMMTAELAQLAVIQAEKMARDEQQTSGRRRKARK